MSYYHGIAFFLAAVIGIGVAAYTYYTQTPPQTYGAYTGSGSYDYQYTPFEPPREHSSNKRRRRSAASNNSVDTCVICCENLVTNVRILPCRHSFHDPCINKWFKIEKSCPLCRKPV